MWNWYDILYGAGLAIASPYWLIKPSARRKVVSAFGSRMGRGIARREEEAPCILIHAVSVGEVNATRQLISRLREQHPGLRFFVSTTTETGHTRAQELYPPISGVTLIRYPLDFSSAINRVLDTVRPTVVVLMELEVWPNFVLRCQQRQIPVILANARLTTSSFRHYRWGGPVVRRMFDRVAVVCAQDQVYADRFSALGIPPHRMVITGTMKFDNASLAPPLPVARRRCELLGLRVDVDPIWVCGSTGPGEEEIILRTYRKLLRRFARLRLVIVPRHPPRFDEVQEIIEQHRFPCLRFTRMDEDDLARRDLAIPPVILVDAMGVLRDFYAFATIVFVGRSLVDLGPRQHGSDMIEPAALAKPVLVGPFTANFAQPVRRLLDGQALLEVNDEESLEQAIAVLISTPAEAAAMGQRAQTVVRIEQGATDRHVRVIMQVLQAKLSGEEAAAKVETVSLADPLSVPQTTPLPPPIAAVSPSPAAPLPPSRPRGKVIITSIGPPPTTP